MTEQDSRALEVATTALTRIEAHEKGCEQLRAEIKASMTRLHQRLDRMIWAMLGVVALIAWSLFRNHVGL